MAVQHSRITKNNEISNANDKNTFIITVNEQLCKWHLNAKKFPDRQQNSLTFPDIPVKNKIP